MNQTKFLKNLEKMVNEGATTKDKLQTEKSLRIIRIMYGKEFYKSYYGLYKAVLKNVEGKYNK